MNAWAHPTHYAKRQLDRCTHFHTMTQQIPHWLQWDAANSPPPKLPLSLRRSRPKSNTPIPSPTPLITPNGIRIQSAVLPQYRCADRQTWDDMVYHNSALLSYSDSERRANNSILAIYHVSEKYLDSTGALKMREGIMQEWC